MTSLPHQIAELTAKAKGGAELTAREGLELVTLSIREERRVAGLPTERVELAGLDLTRLDADERTTLKLLLAKARPGGPTGE